MKRFINKQTLYGALSIVLLIILWEGLAVHFGSELILPGPWKTVSTAFRLFGDAAFLHIVGATLARALLGFAIAASLGIAAGIAAGINTTFRALLSPVLVIIRSIPVVALILMALIWFSSSNVPIFIGMLSMFPLVCTNVMEGIKNVDSNLIEMARFYRISPHRIIGGVYIPAITPFLLSGVSNAMGIGWRAIIVGEVLSLPRYGIGTVMHDAQTYLNIDALLSWTLIAVIVSFLFEKIIRGAEHLLVKWKAQ